MCITATNQLRSQGLLPVDTPCTVKDAFCALTEAYFAEKPMQFTEHDEDDEEEMDFCEDFDELRVSTLTRSQSYRLPGLLPLLLPAPAVLDALFLLFQTDEEVIHNCNQLATAPSLRYNAIDVSRLASDAVAALLQEFLSIDAQHDKLVVYVGHCSGYCDLQCGLGTRLSTDAFAQCVSSSLRCARLFVSVVCVTQDYYGDEQRVQSFAELLRAPRTQVVTLSDRARCRVPTSRALRRDFDRYRDIEKLLDSYGHVRFFEL